MFIYLAAALIAEDFPIPGKPLITSADSCQLFSLILFKTLQEFYI